MRRRTSSIARPAARGRAGRWGLAAACQVTTVAVLAMFALPSAFTVWTTAATATDGDLAIDTEVVASGFEAPVLLAAPDDGSGDRYVVEQRGRIWRIDAADGVDPVPLLDITDRVLHHNERGLLGLAFHPAFGENGRFFVTYSQADDGATSFSEFRLPRAGEVTDDEARTVEATERPLLVIPQVYTTHKAGMLAFDGDGMLVVSTGDGGSGNDPQGHGLDRWSLLGKLLRLDVDHGWPYAIPADNGFAGDPDSRAEIHAIGLRNPWRFSIDRASGDLYIGDVGQSAWEEIDVLPRGTRGASFGWSDMEGPGCLGDRPCDPADHIAPAIAYPHVAGEQAHCAVVGGYAYRGGRATLPQGTYLYGDYCSGIIWAVPVAEMLAGDAAPVVVGHVDPSLGPLQSFGEDAEGELYVVTGGGHILRIVATVAT